MRVLGIDYGRRYIGLALGAEGLAASYGVCDTKKVDLEKELKKILEKENIEQIVVGISEGRMGREQQEFAKYLQKVLQLPVALTDETLTSDEALKIFNKRVSRKESEKREHAAAAAIILERYMGFYSV